MFNSVYRLIMGYYSIFGFTFTQCIKLIPFYVICSRFGGLWAIQTIEEEALLVGHLLSEFPFFLTRELMMVIDIRLYLKVFSKQILLSLHIINKTLRELLFSRNLKLVWKRWLGSTGMLIAKNLRRWRPICFHFCNLINGDIRNLALVFFRSVSVTPSFFLIIWQGLSLWTPWVLC